MFQKNSELSGSTPDSNPQAESNVESIAAPADPLAQLQAEIKTAKQEAAEWQDRFLRKAAELENFRKRSEREKIEATVFAKSSVLLEFLPIADACERALKSFDTKQELPANLRQYQEGIELLQKQVLDAITRNGVVPVESEGKPFDPHLHEALSREETTAYKEDTVVKELRRGYMLKDKLLRPAQVIVAVQPQRKD
jgi:molecular chaperone GrpE